MYVSNIPISRPNPVEGIKPDIDMNGFSWSNKIGMFFHVTDVSISTIKTPPTMSG